MVKRRERKNIRVRVQIIRYARTHSVGKYQSFMFSNVGLSVHAPVGMYVWPVGVGSPLYGLPSGPGQRLLGVLAPVWRVQYGAEMLTHTHSCNIYLHNGAV